MAMDDFLSGLPVVGGLFDDSDEQALEMLRRNQALYEGIELPGIKEYRPEDFQYSGDFRPEDANYKLIDEDPRLRSDQMSALNKLAGYADTGLTAGDEMAFEEARSQGSQMARSGRESAMADAARRGVSGSGMEFAMREISNQEGAGRAQKAGLEHAAEDAKMRAMYTTAYGDALSGVRDQDMRVGSANSGIINQFNQNNTTARNDAQVRNLDSRQAVTNANVQGRNSAQLENNQVRQQGFDNNMRRTDGMAGANTGMAQGYAAQNASRTADRNANTGLAANILFPGAKKPTV